MDVMARSKEAMLVKSLLLALGACLLSATAALAFALGMGGENGVMVETADALYAGDAHGRTMRIVQAGALAPDGGVISDIGVPALAPDGSVIFGAEVRLSERVAWQILRADPNAEDPSRIQKVMDTSDLRSSCKPVIRTDPYVAPGGDGSVSFVATVEGGGVALFRYAAGRLECPVRNGARTAQGHLITNLGIGSAQVAEDGTAILQANLGDRGSAAGAGHSRRAILLAVPGRRATEIAVEGKRTFDGVLLGAQFGLPAISKVVGEPLIAFTNRIGKAESLFVGTPGGVARTLTAGGKHNHLSLAYFSNGRPAIGSDGSVVMRATGSNREMIVVVREGEPLVVVGEGDRLGDGHRLIGLSDPVAELSGRVYAEGTDEQDQNRAYSFAIAGVSPTASSSALSDGLQVFPYSLAIDHRGRFAFLGGHKRPASENSSTQGTSL